jgi:ADP-heptose:LPS heptosyltransferase
MSLPPAKFDPALLTQPRTIIPRRLRHALGALLMGPPRGPRRHTKQACAVALGRIGDFVLCVSTLRLLAREFGTAELAVVVSPALAPLAARELPGVEVITLTPEAASLVRQIVPIWWRERRKFAAIAFERQVTLNHYRSFYHEIAASWIEAKRDFRLQPETYPASGPDGPCTELLAHRLVASAALGRAVSPAEVIPQLASFRPTDDGRLLVYPLSQDPTRSIPAEKIAGLLRAWRAHRRSPVVLGGNPRDRATLEGYATTCRAAGVDLLSIECPDGITAFIDHVAAAAAVVSADSAAGHVAGAFDKPSVVLVARHWFGLSQPWRKSDRQHAFLPEASDAEIAGALAQAWDGRPAT